MSIINELLCLDTSLIQNLLSSLCILFIYEMQQCYKIENILANDSKKKNPYLCYLVLA